MTDTPLVGVFDDHTRAGQAVRQLHEIDISERQIQVQGKATDWNRTHTVAENKGIPEEKRPDFTKLGLSSHEARYYEDQYEAGYTLIMVRSNDRREQVVNILKRNGAYNYVEQPGTVRSKETGAVTPGMRGDDSSQTGIATTSEGVSATRFAPEAVEADLQHVQRVLEEKYRVNQESADK